MFRLYNVNNPDKLNEFAQLCKDGVSVEMADHKTVDMKGANAMEELKNGSHDVIVVLNSLKDLRTYGLVMA